MLEEHSRQQGTVFQLWKVVLQVLELLKKDVLATMRHKHSYPYDWRTKKVWI